MGGSAAAPPPGRVPAQHWREVVIDEVGSAYTVTSPSQTREDALGAQTAQAGKAGKRGQNLRRAAARVGLISDEAVREAAERLRAARKEAGFSSAEGFADYAGLKKSTYQQHENGYRAMNRHSAALYAHLLKVPVGLLLYGDGLSHLLAPVEAPIVGSIQGGSVVQQVTGAGQRTVALLRANDNLWCYEVDDEDLYPAYRPGDQILVPPLVRKGFRLASVDGRECICELADGEIVLRQVIADADGTATLVAYHAPPRLRARVIAASAVHSVYKSAIRRSAAE